MRRRAYSVVAALLCVSSASATPCLRGVNLSGAEFGSLPGKPNTDYTYPAAEEFQRLARLGLTAVRLPFRWERIQPQTGASLDGDEIARLDAAVQSASAAGLRTILDLHNFGYHGSRQIGAADLPVSAFADVWTRLAQHYRDHRDIVFSLMNEPYDIHAADWAKASNAAVTAIRTAGAKQLVIVSGTAYAGAHSWDSDLPTGSNAREIGAIKDPLGRIAFDFHQYFDADFSGRSSECPKAADAMAAIDKVTVWLDAQQARGFLGEFASSEKPECLAALKTLTKRINDDPKHWIGWTAWSAGAWWPSDYIFNLQPTVTGERPQMKILAALGQGGPGCDLGARQ